MTSCGNTNIISSKIDREYWHFYLPVQPTPIHPPYVVEPLSLENNIQLRKLSYIDTRQSYRVSLVLLKKYDDLDAKISSYCLTKESLETVRRACDALSSPKTKPQLPATEAVPTIPLTAPLPSPEQHVYNHLQAAVTHYNVEGNTRRYRVPADEHEPLLPIPVTSRLQNSQAQSPPAWQFQYQTHHSLAATKYYSVHRRSDKTNWKPLLSALLKFLCFCACVMLLAALGYGLFLGITWVFNVITTLVTTIQAGLVRLGHYITHIAGLIAGPFITAGKAISAGWENVVHVLKEIVRWFAQLKGHI